MYVSIEGQGHFLTLAQGNLCMKINTCFSQKQLGRFYANIVFKHLGTVDIMLFT